jgi:hypothetical protein
LKDFIPIILSFLILQLSKFNPNIIKSIFEAGASYKFYDNLMRTI